MNYELRRLLHDFAPVRATTAARLVAASR